MKKLLAVIIVICLSESNGLNRIVKNVLFLFFEKLVRANLFWS